MPIWVKTPRIGSENIMIYFVDVISTFRKRHIPVIKYVLLDLQQNELINQIERRRPEYNWVYLTFQYF